MVRGFVNGWKMRLRWKVRLTRTGNSGAIGDAYGAALPKAVRVVLLVAALCWAGGAGGKGLLACGPFFPNSLLSGSDEAVLTAPEANFAAELERLQLLPKPKPAGQGSGVESGPVGSFARRTLETEMEDLRAALARLGVSPEKGEAIVQAHRQERGKIVIDSKADGQLRPLPADEPRIPQSMPVVVEGLPGEFADYLMGSVGWHAGEMGEARIWWKKLLLRSAEERHYKSTWAAYMLGKSFEEEERRTAIKYFQYVRVLAQEGFADTLKLAPASLGWEARMNVREKKVPGSNCLVFAAGGGGRRGGEFVAGDGFVCAAGSRSGSEKIGCGSNRTKGDYGVRDFRRMAAGTG